MKQQIQTLVEQAKQSVPTGLAPEQWLEVYHTKFAELIVRECAKRIDYWESRQGEHCDDLLKHFGVAE
jgi:hypothetical protein